MSLIRQTSLSPLTRLMLAVALVCALLITQWRLNDHVVTHEFNQINLSQLTYIFCKHDSKTSKNEEPGCLVCLEHQSHGAALTSSFHLKTLSPQAVLMIKALPPNTPYLAPERARQRAPPVLS